MTRKRETHGRSQMKKRKVRSLIARERESRENEGEDKGNECEGAEGAGERDAINVGERERDKTVIKKGERSDTRDQMWRQLLPALVWQFRYKLKYLI
jgi:hypothetical protein